ncbi:MAG: Uma2 family endonuclease [Niabella sp.]
MSGAYKLLPHYTYKDWLLWEGKWELIDGIPYAMSPAPVPKHQRVSAEMIYEFSSALKKSNCGQCRIYDPVDYKISEDTILLPDILTVCGEIQKPYLDFPPALVVEILSSSTALKDRNTKFQLYEQEKVKYYLIVDTDTASVEIYQLVNDKYKLQTFSNSAMFELQENGSITVQLANIFL